MRKLSSYKEFSNMIEMSEYFGMDSMDVRHLIRKGKISCFLDGDMMAVDLDTLPD